MGEERNLGSHPLRHFNCQDLGFRAYCPDPDLGHHWVLRLFGVSTLHWVLGSENLLNLDYCGGASFVPSPVGSVKGSGNILPAPGKAGLKTPSMVSQALPSPPHTRHLSSRRSEPRTRSQPTCCGGQ